MINRGARYKVYATIHVSQLSCLNSSPSGATRHPPFPCRDTVSHTDERGDFSARARSGTRAVSESLSARYRPRDLARPAAIRVGRAGQGPGGPTAPPAATIGYRCRPPELELESTRTLAALKIRNCVLDSGTRKREGTRAPSARVFSNDFGAHAGLPPCTQEGETIRGVLIRLGRSAPAQPETKNHEGDYTRWAAKYKWTQKNR